MVELSLMARDVQVVIGNDVTPYSNGTSTRPCDCCITYVAALNMESKP